MVYFQRRHLDTGDVFLGKKTLRLNRAVITSDVWDFEDALDAGATRSRYGYIRARFSTALSEGGARFERWIDDQRGALRNDAVRLLACSRRPAATQQQAVEWWRRAAELNPYHTDTVLRLANAWVAIVIGQRRFGVPSSMQICFGRARSSPGPQPGENDRAAAGLLYARLTSLQTRGRGFVPTGPVAERHIMELRHIHQCSFSHRTSEPYFIAGPSPSTSATCLVSVCDEERQLSPSPVVISCRARRVTSHWYW